jgi:hypothetical protein
LSDFGVSDNLPGCKAGIFLIKHFNGTESNPTNVSYEVLLLSFNDKGLYIGDSTSSSDTEFGNQINVSRMWEENGKRSWVSVGCKKTGS